MTTGRKLKQFGLSSMNRIQIKPFSSQGFSFRVGLANQDPFIFFLLFCAQFVSFVPLRRVSLSPFHISWKSLQRGLKISWLATNSWQACNFLCALPFLQLIFVAKHAAFFASRHVTSYLCTVITERQQTTPMQFRSPLSNSCLWLAHLCEDFEPSRLLNFVLSSRLRLGPHGALNIEK